MLMITSLFLKQNLIDVLYMFLCVLQKVNSNSIALLISKRNNLKIVIITQTMEEHKMKEMTSGQTSKNCCI